jgi:hypothetical protein
VTFGPPSFNNTPTVQVSVASFNIAGDVSLGCSGVIGFIADAFVEIIKNFLGSMFRDFLGTKLSNALNSELSQLRLSYPFYGNTFLAEFNLVPQQSSIGSRSIQVGVAGIFTPASNPAIVFPFPAPSSSVANTCGLGAGANWMVSLLISSYSLNTLGYSAFALGKLTDTFPSLITSSSLELVIPGFALILGKNASLNLTVSAGYPTFSTNSTAQQLSVGVPMNITIAGDRGTKYVLAVDGSAAVSLVVPVPPGGQPGGVSVSIQIGRLSLSNAQTVYTNVGPSALPLLVGLLDTIVATLVKGLNALLPPIPLPQMDGFQVTAASVSYAQDAVCVQATIRNV